MNEVKKSKELVILVGPPGSGKSTWGKKHAENNNIVYVSTDAIRAEIGLGESDQSVSAAAFGLARKRVSEALASGKNAMIDAANCNKKARKDWINMARGHGASVTAVCFEVSRDELIERDSQRNRTVGPEIIDRFLNKYSRPVAVEEVDKVIVNRS